MAEIVNVLTEDLPALRLVGKRYTHADGKDGGFGHLWGQWFAEGWLNTLEALGQAKGIEGGYLGFMRTQPQQPQFEYWIGMFFAPDTAVPDGFDFIDLPASQVGVCWVKGNDQDRSIFNMHDACVAALQEKGILTGEPVMHFERYSGTRYTQRDADGNVILDYGVFV